MRPNLSTVQTTVQILERRKQMATEFTLILSVSSQDESRARRAMFRALSELEDLESELSEYRPTSPVARLNAAKKDEPVQFSRAGLELLVQSERLFAQTEGTFDPWIKGQNHHPDDRIQRRFKVSGDLVSKTHDDGHLGFGAIGKGFALDRIASHFELEGFRDYLLSAGGSSLIFSGFARPGEPWSWAWSWGKDADGDRVGIPLLHLSGQRMAVGVSGTEEQGHHILSPMAVAPNESRSALVSHPSAAMADALSTALFVGGWKNSLLRFQNHLMPLPGCARIDLDGVPEWNGIFRHLWGDLTTPIESSQTTSEAQRHAFAIAAGTALLGATLGHAEDSEESVSLDEAPSAGGAPAAPAFNPYTFERQAGWMAPAFAMAAYVLWHLRAQKKKSKKLKNLAVPPSGAAAR